MSTHYYHLRAPFSSIRVEESGPHTRITLWERGANCGTLTVSSDVAHEVTLLLADRTGDTRAPMRTRYGGDAVGCVVTERHKGMSDLCHLISEYGQVITVADIRAWAGRGKKKS